MAGGTDGSELAAGVRLAWPAIAIVAAGVVAGLLLGWAIVAPLAAGAFVGYVGYTVSYRQGFRHGHWRGFVDGGQVVARKWLEAEQQELSDRAENLDRQDPSR